MNTPFLPPIPPSTTPRRPARKPLDGVSKRTRELLGSAARAELGDSREWTESTLHRNWEQAYQYYRGEKPKAQTATTSEAISTDVPDAVEWMLPAVLKPLVESPDVVRFDPVNEEDQEQADVESDYVHHSLMKKCNGFLKLYVHIKDALLLKNAIFCTYWDDLVTNQVEEYENLSDVELAMVTEGTQDEVTILSHETREEALSDPVTGLPLPPDPDMPVAAEARHDVRLRRIGRQGRPVVENCAPEAFRVARNHDSIDLDEARWCAYSMRRRRAQLIAMGYDPKRVDLVPAGTRYSFDEPVAQARRDVEEDNFSGEDNVTGDSSQDEVELHRVYMRLDTDDDGFEEHWLVVLGGSHGEVLLDAYEVAENPFSASTPFIAGHKFYGYSLFDKLKRLADHKSHLLRLMEDNLALINNPRKKVIRGRATMDDLFHVRPGHFYRVDQPDALEELPAPPVQQAAMNLFQVYDKQRAERTGIDPNAQSVAQMMPEESMNAAMERVISMKEELVGLVIRVFAETGVRSMMVKLRNLMLRHQPKEEIVQLRNKWATVNPSNWIERTATTIKVGLGTGDRIKKQQALMGLFQIQQTLMQMQLSGIVVSPHRIAHTVSELVRVSGLGDPDDFLLSPALLGDPRNMMTPKGKEMQEAFAIQAQQAQQAQQMEQAKAQAAAEQQRELYQVQLQLEQIKAQARLAEAKLKEQAETLRWAEEMRHKWAELAAEETEAEDKLVLETARARVQNRAVDVQQEQARLAAAQKSDRSAE